MFRCLSRRLGRFWLGVVGLAMLNLAIFSFGWHPWGRGWGVECAKDY